MRYTYILRVDGKDAADIARILGPAKGDAAGGWAYELEEGPDDPPTPFVDVFLDVLQGKRDRLEGIGVTRDDITIWVLYEYDDQCNLEFSAADLKRLGDAGIALCVSCWQAAP